MRPALDDRRLEEVLDARNQRDRRHDRARRRHAREAESRRIDLARRIAADLVVAAPLSGTNALTRRSVAVIRIEAEPLILLGAPVVRHEAEVEIGLRRTARAIVHAKVDLDDSP